MNIAIERRLVNLNSEDASQYNNGTYLSDVNFDFAGLLRDQRNIMYCEGGILNAQIPVSFYQVAYYNNTLYFEVAGSGIQFITVPVGNYNFSTFATALTYALSGAGYIFTITIDETTGKLTFNISGFPDFTFFGASSGTTIFKILGFDPTQDYYSVGTTLTAPYLLNLLGAKKLKIFSTTFSNTSYDSASSTACNLISTISVDAPSYGLLLYNNTQDKYGQLKTRRIDSIDIQIKDEYGNFINFNNTDWSITLAILIYRKLDTRLADLADVVNGLTNVSEAINGLDTDILNAFAQVGASGAQGSLSGDGAPVEEIPTEIPSEVPAQESFIEPNLDETTDLDLLLYENPALF